MNDDNSILLLSSDSFIMINESLLKGLEGNAYEAIILSKLINLYKYFNENKLLTYDGYFFQTIENIYFHCGITESRQRAAIKSLEERGVITTKLLGSPPKRHFKLHTDKIVNLLSKSNISIIDNNKEQFYLDLNKAIHTSWRLIQQKGGVIDKQLLWFMYNFNYESEHRYNISITITPQFYGIIRTYWRSRYLDKNFDYLKLEEYAKQCNGHMDIKDFIKFDRLHLDRPLYEYRKCNDFYLRNLRTGELEAYGN